MQVNILTETKEPSCPTLLSSLHWTLHLTQYSQGRYVFLVSASPRLLRSTQVLERPSQKILCIAAGHGFNIHSPPWKHTPLRSLHPKLIRSRFDTVDSTEIWQLIASVDPVRSTWPITSWPNCDSQSCSYSQFSGKSFVVRKYCTGVTYYFPNVCRGSLHVWLLDLIHLWPWKWLEHLHSITVMS